MFVREAADADRPAVRALFESDFGRTKIVAFGEVMDIDQMPVLVALVTQDLAGALAYRSFGDALHMVALATDPMWQRSGVGGHLVAEAELLARRLHLGRAIVATTNDNLPALYFYQRRGYRLTDLVPNSITVAHRPGSGRLCRHSRARRDSAGEASHRLETSACVGRCATRLFGEVGRGRSGSSRGDRDSSPTGSGTTSRLCAFVQTRKARTVLASAAVPLKTEAR